MLCNHELSVCYLRIMSMCTSLSCFTQFEQAKLCMLHHLSTYQGWQQNTQADQEEATWTAIGELT